jgi:hypothetical protein
MIRRLTSLLAAIALIFAMAVPPASACEGATGEASDVVATMAGSAHSMDGGAQSHCPQPANPEHDAECLATCLSMMACSSPCFVIEAALAGKVEHVSAVPRTTTQQYASRSFAPDRPPPRI